MDVKTLIKRIDKYGDTPESAVDALTQAIAYLKDEGDLWTTGSVFEDGDPAEAYQNGSICGVWKACALGVLGLVTGEMPVRVIRYGSEEYESSGFHEGDYNWDVQVFEDVYHRTSAPLVSAASDHIALAIALRDWAYTEKYSSGGSSKPTLNSVVNPWNGYETTSAVYHFNDRHGREDVIEIFQEALELAKKDV